jgi:hypothetical protein
MAEKKLPQYAAVKQTFGCDPAVVHCPICGASAYRVNEQGKQRPPCHHLAFVYVGEVGEFVYQSMAFENKFRQVDIKEVSFESFPALLEQAGYDNQMLAIQVAYGDMVDGKAHWYTDVYGYDYNTIKPCKD